MTSVAEFKLTTDQESALNKFYTFLLDPNETVFVLSGYSGCGKSTLVRTLLDQLPKFQKSIQLIDPKHKTLAPVLTATTNKAAENLGHISGEAVGTIQSFLGLRVNTDFKTGVTTLIPNKSDFVQRDCLLFIDEASYVDKTLLGYVFSRTVNTKVVFIGDPAQLAPVKSTSTPVFEAGFGGAALTQVVRQAEGNPIIDLSTKFRHTVNTGEFFSFKPDGESIKHLDRTEFTALIEAEFTRSDWKYSDSKILAWTNKTVVGYNQYLRNKLTGDPHFQVGDYAVCNTFLTAQKTSFKTDQLVQLTGIEEDCEYCHVKGNWVRIDHVARVFHPKSLADKAARIRKAKSDGHFGLVAEIETSWADLRGAYASTVNKSQGSTYDKVFIDLDDISRCNQSNTLARMLYVAVSRARNQVILVGDLA